MFSKICKTREEKVGLLISRFSFQQFNHTGGLALHQSVKCLIFLLVSFFFLHNECKSKNVNKAFPHHTHALLPPPASYPCSDLPASLPRTPHPSFASYRSCSSAASSRCSWPLRGVPFLGRRQHRKPSHLLPSPPRLPPPPPLLLPPEHHHLHPRPSRGVEADPALKACARRSTETPISMHPGKGD